MAYAELVHLKHIVEEQVICFLRSVLEAENAKAVEFQAKANQGLKRLNILRYSSRCKVSSGKLLLESAASVLNDLDGISSSLEDFLHCSLDGPSSLQQREIARDLLSGNREIRAELASCKKACEAAISIRQTLGELIAYSDSVSAREAMWSRLKMTVNEAACSIEDFLTGIQTVKRLYDVLEQTDYFLSDSMKRLFELEYNPLPFQKTRSEFMYENEIGGSALSRRERLWKAHDGDDVVIGKLLGLPAELKDVRIWEGRDSSEITLAERLFDKVSLHFECYAMLGGGRRSDRLLSGIRACLVSPGMGNPLFSPYVQATIEDEGELLHKSLKGRKYLIVLHGLQKFDIWDAIQSYFPDDKLGSRVLLSCVLNPWKLAMDREDVVVGLEEEMRKIIDELTRPPSTLSIVRIAGMGGIGKTTLAKHIFKHPYVSSYFHRLAWISTVSTIDQVLSHLLQQVPRDRELQGGNPEDKGDLLRKSLKGRKYLLVVDDLWNFEVWNAVQEYLPDDKVGSRILITTRMTEFPAGPARTSLHSMTLMDKNQSWELLQKLVFVKKRCPDKLVEIGKQIAEACGGLPLAVVVIAGFLSSPYKNSSTKVWESVKREVIRIVSANSEACMDILSFSYKYLPVHLKSCFLFMGAFPANAEIGVEYLLRLWVANGFLEPEFYNDSEIDAEEYFNDLVGRNLVSIGKRGLDGKIKTCFIHPLVRQLCLGEAQKENLMHVLEPNATAQVLENKRHLIFNLDSLDGFQSLPSHSHLCSIMWINNPSSDFALGKLLLQMLVCKLLRVLDIYFVPFDTFPLELLSLVNLRFLAINVSYALDARLSQLSKLETLVVYGPWIPKPALFLEFWKMMFLRHVQIKVPCCLDYPYPLSSILEVPQAPSSLQILSVITFSSCTTELFLLMPKLKKLGVSETKADFENAVLTQCFRNLSFLKQLQALNCSFYREKGETRDLDFNALPVSLKKLTLAGGNMSWGRIKLLALLPKLETLKLKNHAFQGPEWVVDGEVFGSLKHLLIENTDLVNWEVESTENFPCLKRLVLRSCGLLEKIPEGVCELSVLEVIELHHCSESATSSAQEYEEQNGFPKVVCWG